MKTFILLLIMVTLIFSRRNCLDEIPQRNFSCEGRINKDRQYYSPNNLFCIHYNIYSGDLDTTDNNNNNIPDYIESVAIIADSAHQILVNEMQYNDVPEDNDGIYDIYVKDYSEGSFGHCCKDYPSQNNIKQTSYLQIDSDYSDNLPALFVDSSIEFMNITLVHEYFHAIQYGYRSSNIESYFYELSSMWVEDVIVPDGDDYLDWPIDNLLNNPQATFGNSGPGYELALFGHYLSSFLDTKGYNNVKNSTIMREIWEKYASVNINALSAIKYILEENYDITFIEVWTDFMTRNLYNGLYQNMDNDFYYYLDQSLINPIKTNNITILDSIDLNFNLDNKSIDLISYKITDFESILSIYHDHSDYVGNIVLLSNDLSKNKFYNIADTQTQQLFPDDKIHLIYGSHFPNLDLNVKINRNTVPLPPSNLVGIEEQDSILLLWNASLGPGDSLEYIIYRDYDSLTILPDTQFVDKYNIEGSTNYSYYIVCKNNVGKSSKSNTINLLSWPAKESVLNRVIISLYPNPLQKKQELYILYALDKKYLNIELELINIKGQILNTILSNANKQGWHRENISNLISHNMSSGIYFVRIRDSSNFSLISKLIILP